MDVLDAGVFVAKWEAEVPKLQTVLWGPLQAKEMGFEGWECQDGGETGFVYHNPHIRLAAGFATSTLIVVNRLRKAYLTIYFGGYPTDHSPARRRIDQDKVVGAVQTFLSRLAKKPLTMEFQGEMALVDHNDDGVLSVPASAPAALPGSAAEPAAGTPDAATEQRQGVWEV